MPSCFKSHGVNPMVKGPPITLMEIRERDGKGSVHLEIPDSKDACYHPVALVNGEAYDLNVIRDNGNVTLEFKTTTSSGVGTHNVALENIVKLPEESPIFEGEKYQPQALK